MLLARNSFSQQIRILGSPVACRECIDPLAPRVPSGMVASLKPISKAYSGLRNIHHAQSLTFSSQAKMVKPSPG